jgi:hypothetical protein
MSDSDRKLIKYQNENKQDEVFLIQLKTIDKSSNKKPNCFINVINMPTEVLSFINIRNLTLNYLNQK